MSDPWLSFSAEKPTRTLKVVGPAALRLPMDSHTRGVATVVPSVAVDDSPEMALFPELLDGCGRLDDINMKGSGRNLAPPPGRNVTRVIKVVASGSASARSCSSERPVANATEESEEELIRYLKGRCNESGYELDSIADVTDDFEDQGPLGAVTINMDQLGETVANGNDGLVSPSSSTHSLGSDGEAQHKNYIVTEMHFPATSDTCRGETQSLSGRNNLSASKSAQSARENRIKKKQYIDGLEKSVEVLTTENKQLKTDVSTLKSTVQELSTEVQYLKNVLANQSMLSSLLKNTLKTPGAHFVSSEFEFEDVDVETVEEPKSANEGVQLKKVCQESPRNMKRVLEEDLCLSSDDEDGTTFKSVLSATKSSGHPASSVCTRTAQSKKFARVDHAYADEHSAAVAGKCRMFESSCEASKENVQDNKKENAGGICLHVSSKTVSLEFCPECCNKASAARGKRATRHFTRTARSCREQVQV